MKTTTWRSKISLLTLSAALACSSGGAVAAQYIETATPAAATEEATGGDWGNLASALTGGSTATRSTTAVSGDIYVLPSSGAEVVVADGVTVSESSEGDVEDQIIIETDDGIGAVAVLETTGQPVTTLERYVSGFAESMDDVVEVDVQSSADLATGVYRVETTGLSLYMYVSIDAQPLSGYVVIEVVIADAADIETSIVQMRENVTINGVAAFAEVNEADVAGIIRTDEG